MGWADDDDDDDIDLDDGGSNPFSSSGSSGGNPFSSSGSSGNPFSSSDSSENPFSSSGSSGNPFASPSSENPFARPSGGSPFGTSGGGSPFGNQGGGSPFGSPGGGVGGSPFGSPSGGSPFGSPSGGSPFGRPSGFGGSPFGGGMQTGFGNNNPFGAGMRPGFGGANQMGPRTLGGATMQPGMNGQQSADLGQIGGAIFLASSDAIMVTIKSLFESIKLRNIDDWASVGHSWLITSGVTFVTGIFLLILGMITQTKALKLGGLSGALICSSLLVFAFGAVAFGLSMYLKSTNDKYFNGQQAVTSQDDLLKLLSQPVTSDFQLDSDDDLFKDDDFFQQDSEEDIDKLASALYTEEEEDPDTVAQFVVPEITVKEEENPEVDFAEQLKSIPSNIPFLSKRYLFEMMKSFFPLKTPNFADTHELDLDSEEVGDLEEKINNALDVLSKNEELRAEIIQVYSTVFAYEIHIKRVKKIKPAELASELTNFFKKDKTDIGAAIDIATVANEYVITVSKSGSVSVFVGDCFRSKSVEDYITNEKNTLPVIAGINEEGTVKMVDFKDNLSSIISGKPRSGKTWYVYSTLMTLTAFNSPEDLQLIVIDPKTSQLLESFSTLPHVCGFHDATMAAEALRATLRELDERRKLLREARVDTIWDYRKTGKKMPVLYLVIDEFIDVLTTAKEKGLDKEIKDNLNVILTKAPSCGIGCMLICHRTAGYVDKLMRMNTAFKVIARAEADAVVEELMIDKKDWSHPLLYPGDLAVKGNGFDTAIYLKGTGVTMSDAENGNLSMQLARAWYKMGVTIPDMSILGAVANRNEDKVKDMLSLEEEDNRIQYDFAPSKVEESSEEKPTADSVKFNLDSLLEDEDYNMPLDSDDDADDDDNDDNDDNDDSEFI